MEFFVTQDADITAGLDSFLNVLRSNGFESDFLPKQYNDLGTDLGIVLMCRQPYHRFKQRIRHSKKDNTLYIDLMLELAEMASMPPTEKISFIARKMLVELPPIISKYRKLDFDILRFSRDLREWYENHGVVIDDLSADSLEFPPKA